MPNLYSRIASPLIVLAGLSVSAKWISASPLEPPAGLKVIAFDPETTKIFLNQPDGMAKSTIQLDETDRAKVGATAAIQLQILHEFKNVWDIQLCEKTIEAVHRGQPGLLRFWARSPGVATSSELAEKPGEPPSSSVASVAASTSEVTRIERQIAVYLQRASEPWDKSFMTKLPVLSDWQRYEIPFRIHESFAAAEAQLCVGLGFSPQTIELAAIELLVYPLDVDLETLPSSVPSVKAN